MPQSQTGKKTIQIETGQQERITIELSLPPALAPGEYELEMTAAFRTGEVQQDTFTIHVLPREVDSISISKIALFDPKGETTRLLQSMNVTGVAKDANADLSAYDILIIGKEAISLYDPAPDLERVRDGLKVIVFEQTPDVLEKRLGFRIQEYGLRNVFTRVADHPILSGLRAEHLADWCGEATIVPPTLTYEIRPQNGPTIRWCGIEVPRSWRRGCWGNVASVLLEKPARGDFLPIVDGGFSLQYSSLMEYREGKGMILFCQLDVTSRTEEYPAARRLVANMLQYISDVEPAMQRKAIYAGEAAGHMYFERTGIPFSDYHGERLSSDQVLIVGPGGSANLAPHKNDVESWLQAGGRLLAIGLDEADVTSFLPLDIAMQRAEHIDALFEPAEMHSPLAGIGPADVLIRDPRQIPLVNNAAFKLGDGVLARVPESNVILCQLVPWQFDYQNNFHLKMTYRRTSFLVARLLAGMGVGASTPLLAHFSTPLKNIFDANRSILKNGDFQLDQDRDGFADIWQAQSDPGRTSSVREPDAQNPNQWIQRISLLDAGADQKGSAMLAQMDVPLQSGQWYGISLRARSEGLQGSDVNMTIMDTKTWQSFFDVKRFHTDSTWKTFTFYVESNKTADADTKFQIWFDHPGTIWLSDIRMASCDPPQQGRWLDGLYLDQPEELDDPYRFFRW